MSKSVTLITVDLMCAL